MNYFLTKTRNLFILLSTPFKGLISFIIDKCRYNKVLSFTYGITIGKGSTFEGCNTIGDKSHFSGKMGYGSYMSSFCSIEGNIGRFTSIGPEVVTPRGVHPFRPPYVATSPMFFSTKRITRKTFVNQQKFDEWKPPVVIGNDVWIGQRVLITGGITIGDGAVVYACAVVTKDVPPYSIVAGIPAKVIGYRYQEDIIEKLLKIQWWNKPLSWIENHAELFTNIDEFVKLAE